jgi:hypothetical protein
MAYTEHRPLHRFVDIPSTDLINTKRNNQLSAMPNRAGKTGIGGALICP